MRKTQSRYQREKSSQLWHSVRLQLLETNVNFACLVWGGSPQLPEARRSGAPAAENFCIFYVKKVNFSAFNRIICCNNILLQAWATYGQRTVSGPRDHFMLPAGTYKSMTSYRESSRTPFTCL